MSLLTDPDRRDDAEAAGAAGDQPPAGLGRYRRVAVLALAMGAAILATWTMFGPSERPATPEESPAVTAAAPEPAPTRVEPREAPPPPDPDAGRTVRARPRPAPAPPEPAGPAAPVHTGVLRVESDVPGAMVFLDRQYLGTTPFSATDLEPGTHRLNVSAEGYEGFADTLTLSADAPVDISVRFKEVRLSESVQVVHRHGMGSCQGTLVASLDGLAYQTAHRDDAFRIPFPELETLEIDYLKQNLRIKRRAGRTYNFTDEQPNADALLVFHRAVEKARAQLGRK